MLWYPMIKTLSLLWVIIRIIHCRRGIIGNMGSTHQSVCSNFWKLMLKWIFCQNRWTLMEQNHRLFSDRNQLRSKPHNQNSEVQYFEFGYRLKQFKEPTRTNKWLAAGRFSSNNSLLLSTCKALSCFNFDFFSLLTTHLHSIKIQKQSFSLFCLDCGR